jgi:hypothetical protein
MYVTSQEWNILYTCIFMVMFCFHLLDDNNVNETLDHITNHTILGINSSKQFIIFLILGALI